MLVGEGVHDPSADLLCRRKDRIHIVDLDRHLGHHRCRFIARGHTPLPRGVIRVSQRDDLPVIHHLRQTKEAGANLHGTPHIGTVEVRNNPTHTHLARLPAAEPRIPAQPHRVSHGRSRVLTRHAAAISGVRSSDHAGGQLTYEHLSRRRTLR